MADRDRLAALLHAIDEARARLDEIEYELIQYARENGETWDELGAKVGISRQAAQSRWYRVQRRQAGR